MIRIGIILGSTRPNRNREQIAGRRLNGRKPIPGIVKPLCDRWRTAGIAENVGAVA